MSFRGICSVYFGGAIYPAFRDSQKIRLSSKLSMHVISRATLWRILMKGVTYPGSTGHVKPIFVFLVPTTNKSPPEIRRGVHRWHMSQYSGGIWSGGLDWDPPSTTRLWAVIASRDQHKWRRWEGNETDTRVDLYIYSFWICGWSGRRNSLYPGK